MMPALLLSGEPVPVRLMDTVWADRSGLHDDLSTVDDLGIWLAAVDPDHGRDVPLDQGDLRRFRALRDALRHLAAFVTGDSRPGAAPSMREVDAAVEEVNRAVERASTWPLLMMEGDRLRRRPADVPDTGVRHLSAIAAQAVDLLTGPESADLRACYSPPCVLYFVKQHPRREWCSPTCGNRARAARHYARHRSGHSD